MYAMNLVDAADMKTTYGILFCSNDDVIKMLPQEWKMELQCKIKQITI